MNYYFFYFFVERAILAVDLMFFLSGFRLFQSVYDSAKNDKTIFLKKIQQWLIAIYPGYTFFICMLKLMTFFTFASYKDIFENFLSNCEFNWWKQFTFISNHDHIIDQVSLISFKYTFLKFFF